MKKQGASLKKWLPKINLHFPLTKKAPPKETPSQTPKREAMTGSALDYIGGDYIGYGRPFSTTAKFEGGLINYEQPSSINIRKLRSESRKALLDSPELIALARTLKVLVIGDGLRVSSAPERTFVPELQDSTEEEIKKYRESIDTLWEMVADSTSFDLLGERNLYCLMQDAFEKWIQDGEVIILFSIEDDPKRLKNTLTPIRVSFALPDDMKSSYKANASVKSPSKLKDGVEIDERGVPVAYWIKDERVEKTSQETGRTKVSILKNGQTFRGVPPFSCAIQEAKLLQDYQLAEVQKNALGSQIFMTAKENQSELLQAAAKRQLKSIEHRAPSSGEIVHLSRQGVNLLKVSNHDQVSSLETPRPAPGFSEFTTTIQKRICMTLGMSRDIVSKDTTSSYSAARFQAQLTELEVATYRMRFIDAFLRPLYENWFRYCVAAKYFPFVKNFNTALTQKSWMAIEVLGRPLPDLSPMQEASALKTYLDMGVITRNDITKMLGFPKYEDTYNTLLNEEKERAMLGAKKENKGGGNAKEQRSSFHDRTEK